MAETTIQGLTFLFASSLQDLDNLITREFHADPNIHKNPQVALLGDYMTGESPSVQATWTWKWKPPRSSENTSRGWRTSCCFVEYNHHAHRLDPLASFTVWVKNTQPSYTSPRALSPLNPPIINYKLRIPSVQSTTSASDSQPSATDPSAQTHSLDVPSDPAASVSPAASSSVASPPEAMVKVDIPHHRAGDDFCNIDDGPIFRSAMKSMEQKTSNMKNRWKKALKRAEEAHDAHIRFNDASLALIESLKEISMSSTNSIQPAIEHYFKTIAKRIMEYEHRTSVNLQKMVIEPIARYYSFDIKQADSKRKDFEDESREYYAYVSRYLGARHDTQKEKKRTETDTKYQTKRRHFELKRFDYSSFVQDLHGGRKDQEVLSNLTRYAEAQANDFLITSKSIESMLPELKALIHEVKEADKEFKLQRSEREEKRRALETVSSNIRDLDISSKPPYTREPTSEQSVCPPPTSDSRTRPHPGFPTRSASSALPHSAHSQVHAQVNNGVSNFEIPSQKNVENGLCHKEGILWSTSRTGTHLESKSLNMNKPAMHPYWVVLDQGMLAEYKKWQESFSSHPDQVINIRVASARENHDGKSPDSQLCFTVITPNASRTYQTTSNEEMKNWVAAINRAAQSALADNSSDRQSDVASTKVSGRPGKDGLTSPMPVRRHATVGTRAYGSSSNSEALLKDLQSTNASNRECADCASTAGVTWAVINYGIIVCIKCSGVHRSLGSHISKVRSLTLDSTAFTADVVELLRVMGNKQCNAILEHQISEPSQKLISTAADEQRKKFILAKYSDHIYVMPLSSSFPTPNELLIQAVKAANVYQVLHALALKANPNFCDRDDVPVFYHSLAAEDPHRAGPSSDLLSAHQPKNVPPPLSLSPYSPGLVSPMASPNAHAPTMQSPPSLSLAQSPPTGPGPPARPVSRCLFPVAELLLLNGAELPGSPCPLSLSPSAVDYLSSKRIRMESSTMKTAKAPETEVKTSQKRASVAGKLSRIGGRREVV